MKTANLFLNGTFVEYSDVDRSVYTVAADGGVVNALKNKCIPDIIIGDGDSIQQIPTKYRSRTKSIPFEHASDQNYADIEKALQYLENHDYTYIKIYCFSGERIDHMLAGLSACNRFQGMQIELCSSSQKIIKLPYNYSLKCSPGETLSLLPYPTAQNVTTSGLKWELQNSQLKLGNFISISNEATTTNVTIKYTNGVLYLFRPI
jgi:thiamine pyrophosphokinase